MQTPPPSPDDGSGTAPVEPKDDPGFLRSLLLSRAPLQRTRILALAMVAVLPETGVYVFYTAETPLAWSPLGLLLPGLGILGVAVAGLVPLVRPLAPDTPPDHVGDTARMRVRGAMVVRLVLCELPALLGIVGCYLVPEQSVLPFLVGVAITLLGMATVGWPTRTAVERDRARLESRGVRSHLWNALLDQETVLW